MAQISKEKLKKVKEIELAISKNLFAICALVTVLAMAMVIVEFFTRGIFPPPGMNLFYIGVLFIYSAHKEMLRWLEEKEIERQGEWFVYSWIGLTVILYIINFVTRGYYLKTPEGASAEALRDIAITTLEVCVIFIITRLSKVIKIILEKNNKSKF